MSLYSKKLHIKKPNGVIQTANLYTDKSDVGNNYLTFKDGGNTIYSVLDVNGDIDCKINKNNINYKIKKENVVNVPSIKQDFETAFNYTIPKGVKVIKFTFFNDYRTLSKVFYFGVQENVTYRFVSIVSSVTPDHVLYSKNVVLHIYNLQTRNHINCFITSNGSGGYEIETSFPCNIEYSNDINNHAVDYNV